MSLKSYCEERNKLRLLKEWDTEKNLPITPRKHSAHQQNPCLVAL